MEPSPPVGTGLGASSLRCSSWASSLKAIPQWIWHWQPGLIKHATISSCLFLNKVAISHSSGSSDLGSEEGTFGSSPSTQQLSGFVTKESEGKWPKQGLGSRQGFLSSCEERYTVHQCLSWLTFLGTLSSAHYHPNPLPSADGLCPSALRALQFPLSVL